MTEEKNVHDRKIMKLVALQGVDEGKLKAVAPGIQVLRTNGEGVVAAAAGADVLIGKPPRGRLPEVLRAAPGLRWMHVSSAGVDDLLCPELAAAPLVLTCGKGRVVGPLLAEHAFAMMLSLTRGIVLSVREGLKEGPGKWNRHGGQAGRSVFEVGGRTLGIIGYGGVGEELARRASAFGMRVIAVRRSVRGDEEGAEVWPADRLYDLLEASDVVAVTVPGTPDTRGMLDDAAFARFKPGSFLVTVGRGDTVVTDALVRALASGRLAGAGLDVVDPEPLPDDHPLWQFPNVVITPHIAGNAPERAVRNQDLVVENLARLCQGQPLLSVVDKTAGY